MGENEATIRSLLEVNEIALDKKQMQTLNQRLRLAPPDTDWWKDARKAEKITQKKIAGSSHKVWVLDEDCWEDFVAWVKKWMETP